MRGVTVSERWRGLIWPVGWALAVLLAGDRSAARADVKLPAIFGDHMVLQRDQKDRVWGWADPGEEVTVAVTPHDQSKTATAGADGKWQVTLDPLATGGPYTVTVKGKNTITFNDVLAGKAWVCSGQSNMQVGRRWVHRWRSGDPVGELSRHPPDHRAQPRHPGAAEGFSRQVGALLASQRRGLLGRGIPLRPPAPSDSGRADRPDQ